MALEITMRWQGREQSSNIEDRRGMRIGRVGGIGGAGAIIVALIALYFGEDPSAVLQNLQGEPASVTGEPYQESAREAQSRQIIAVVLKDTEQTWQQLFAANGKQYQEPRLVLFSGAVQSACGTAQSAVGPFYCSADSQVYIDLSFYDDLKSRFGAPGDFAQAYVVAHEVGHHVQHLLGTSDKVHLAQQRNASQANTLSVRLELQADCYAGVWAQHAGAARQLLESGDVEEGLAAASAIGDDRLQMQTRGYIAPESFTHGSSAQRVRWFKRGLQSGNMVSCDTFAQRANTDL
jgi:uncharacterized protein